MLTGGITTELWLELDCPGVAWLRLVPTMLTLFRVLLICRVPELLTDWEGGEPLVVLVLGIPLSELPPAWIRAVCWREQAWIEEACWRKMGGTLDLGPLPATARNWSEAVELST